MTQAEESAGRQCVKKGISRLTAGKIIKIDQKIATEDNVEIPVPSYISCVHDVDPGKFHRLTQLFTDLISVPAGYKIFFKELFGEIL